MCETSTLGALFSFPFFFFYSGCSFLFVPCSCDGRCRANRLPARVPDVREDGSDGRPGAPPPSGRLRASAQASNPSDVLRASEMFSAVSRAISTKRPHLAGGSWQAVIVQPTGEKLGGRLSGMPCLSGLRKEMRRFRQDLLGSWILTPKWEDGEEPPRHLSELLQPGLRNGVIR